MENEGNEINVNLREIIGPGSSIGIATGYGLDGPEIESRWGRDFPHPSRRPCGPPWLPYNRYRVVPGVQRPERDADHPSHTLPRLKKEYGYTSIPPLGFVACSTVKFTFIFYMCVCLLGGGGPR